MFALRCAIVAAGCFFASTSAADGPPITVLPHCAGGDQHGWPSFDTEAALRANKPWMMYFKAVYGKVPSTGYPICTFSLSHLYKPHLDSAGVTLPAMSAHCPTGTGEYYSTMSDHQDPWSTWVWNQNLAQPASKQLPGQTWVEIIHQSYFMDGSASWMYYTPGTAIWFFLGSTRSYDDHDGATDDLLHEPCQAGGPVGNLKHECVPQFPRLYHAALAAGLDSLQFRQHADMPCGSEQHRQNMAIEIVDLGGPGTESCGQKASGHSRYRAGWEAASPCDCDNSQPTVNCAGFGIRSSSPTPPPPPSTLSGLLAWQYDRRWCVDINPMLQLLEITWCNPLASTQRWHLDAATQTLRTHDGSQCAVAQAVALGEHHIQLKPCTGLGDQQWSYNIFTTQIRHAATQTCMVLPRFDPTAPLLGPLLGAEYCSGLGLIPDGRWLFIPLPGSADSTEEVAV